MREESLTIDVPEKLGEGLVSVEAGAPLDLDLRLESVHEGILVSGEASAVAKGVCGRCLTDIAEPYLSLRISAASHCAKLDKPFTAGALLNKIGASLGEISCAARHT